MDINKVLIAHSRDEVVKTLEAALAGKGAQHVQILDETGAFEALDNSPAAAVLIEAGLPGPGGLVLMQKVRARHPDLPVVLISPDGSARAALEAMRLGASDYLAEPLDPLDLNDCLTRIFEDESGAGESRAVSGPPGRYDHIIGRSPAIRQVFRLVDKVADTDSTVMVYGESGTGKELIARAIHNNSRRCGKPLIPVNCGAIPEELLESELFGHEKGAFTSAIRTRIGRFELSDGGTIFLDEIADMSPKLQVKILRVLQEHKFERIGGAKTIDVDIRVITATNKDLRQAMEAGRFREDLFYRLNVIPITVPPLRERREDIPLLAKHFLQKFRVTRGAEVSAIDTGVMNKFMDYSWPGNIRELENIIERMVILAEGETLKPEDLPVRINNAAPIGRPSTVEITEDGLDFNQVVSDFEDQLLLQALEMTGWVKNKAAKLLKLNRTTLVEKLKKKGLRPPNSSTVS